MNVLIEKIEVDEYNKYNIHVLMHVDKAIYHGRGENLREALNHLVDVLKDHEAPVPGVV